MKKKYVVLGLSLSFLLASSSHAMLRQATSRVFSNSLRTCMPLVLQRGSLPTFNRFMSHDACYKCGACGIKVHDERIKSALLKRLQTDANLKKEPTAETLWMQFAETSSISWFKTVKAGLNSVVSALLDLGCDVNQQNCHEKTALHIAIECEEWATVDTLLDRDDIDLNVPDADGNTPVHLIVFKKDYTRARRMIHEKHGLTSIKNLEGVAPLDVIAQLTFENRRWQNFFYVY